MLPLLHLCKMPRFWCMPAASRPHWPCHMSIRCTSAYGLSPATVQPPLVTEVHALMIATCLAFELLVQLSCRAVAEPARVHTGPSKLVKDSRLRCFT